MVRTVRGFSVVNEAELVICFFYHPTGVGHLVSCSSAFSKSSLYIWNFLVHILLKPGLKDCEHYLANLWNECSCTLIWTFFNMPFFGIGMKTDLFQSCDQPLLSYPNLMAYWMQNFNSSIFYDLKYLSWDSITSFLFVI